MNRRNFLTNLAKSSAVVGLPYFIPARALGLDGNVAPSNRITVGSIGLGLRGIPITKNLSSDKRVQLVALCDVNNIKNCKFYGYENKSSAGLDLARRTFGMDIPTYSDFREVLMRKDIDAIITATPDHWHAIIGLATIRSGKDIFSEKPLTRTIREGQVLRDCVMKSGRIWQTGSFQRSSREFIQAVELVRNGHIGDIKRIEIGLPKNFVAEVLKNEPIQEGLDWDMWQGPALRSNYYNHKFVFTRWRGVYNYSSGKISDWGAHHLDIANWALNSDNECAIEFIPTYVEWPTNGFSDHPLAFRVDLHYKSGVVIEISDMNKNGVQFYGTKGKLFVSRGTIFSDPIDIASRRILPTDKRVYPARSRKHESNFVDSILDRRKTSTDIDIAHNTNRGCLLSEIAYRLNRPIKWDNSKECIVGDSEASKMCDRIYSAPWQLA